MINYVTFSPNGIRDMEVLKSSDFILVKLEDEKLGMRLSAMLNTEFYPRVKEINKLFGYSLSRDSFSGYMTEKVKIRKGSVLSIRKEDIQKLSCNTVVINPDVFNELKGEEILKEKDTSLENAKLVFLAGRGIGNKENYLLLKEVAKKYGAEVGCSRPVCMNNWESYDRFVGISGKSLNADLLVTFGVSGSNPLVEGILNCKKVISINNDSNALIFNYSDYRIVRDLVEVLKEM